MNFDDEKMFACRRLLEKFVYDEIEKGKDLPDEVIFCILGDVAKHIAPKRPNENELEDFIDDFERYILSCDHYKHSSEVKPRCLNRDILQRLESSENLKIKQLEQTLNNFKKLKKIREIYQKRFEEAVEADEAESKVEEMRLELLKADVMNRILNETSSSLKALQMLQEMLKEENSKLTDRLGKLQEEEKKYLEVNDDQDYQNLLIKWKKLQNQIQVLKHDE